MRESRPDYGISSAPRAADAGVPDCVRCTRRRSRHRGRDAHAFALGQVNPTGAHPRRAPRCANICTRRRRHHRGRDAHAFALGRVNPTGAHPRRASRCANICTRQRRRRRDAHAFAVRRTPWLRRAQALWSRPATARRGVKSAYRTNSEHKRRTQEKSLFLCFPCHVRRLSYPKAATRYVRGPRRLARRRCLRRFRSAAAGLQRVRRRAAASDRKHRARSRT